MTEQISVSNIFLEERQRKVNGDLTSLKESMHDRGLLQCIGVQHYEDGKYRLLWGGRRLAAAKELGWETIEAKVAASMEDYEASELEFLENWERQALTWQEECQAVGRIHKERTRKGALVGEKWGQRETGRLLGVSLGNVNFTLKVAELLDKGDKEIFGAINMAEAWRIILRRKEAENQTATAPKTETYFKPEDMKQFESQPEPAPSSFRVYTLHVWPQSTPTMENVFGCVGEFDPDLDPRWVLDSSYTKEYYPEHDLFTLVFRNTSVKEGKPFLPMLEIFNFYWHRLAIPKMENVIPIFTDNPSIERVLYGPKAMTDGWWDYIFEVVGRENPVFFWWPESIDGIYYCLRKGIECHVRTTKEKLDLLQHKFNAYGQIEIVNH